MVEEEVWKEGECVMWQKDKGKMHLILNNSGDIADGRFMQTACGDLVRMKKDKQLAFVPHIADCCAVCTGVWRLVFTSVDDARSTLNLTVNLVVLRRSFEVTRSKTLRKMITARIRKIEKDAEKERKLRLIQQAYD